MVAIRVKDDEGVGDGAGGPVQPYCAERGQCEWRKKGEENEILRSSLGFDPFVMLVLVFLRCLAGSISTPPSIPTVLGVLSLSLRLPSPCQFSWPFLSLSADLLILSVPPPLRFLTLIIRLCVAEIDRHFFYLLVLSDFFFARILTKTPTLTVYF